LTCHYIIDIDGDEHHQLYEHTDEVAGTGAERDNETWKIYFAENIGIMAEDLAAGCKTGAEIVPEGNACHIEKRLRYAISRNASQPTEDKHVHNGGQ
jgi:hypothetical protein